MRRRCRCAPHKAQRIVGLDCTIWTLEIRMNGFGWAQVNHLVTRIASGRAKSVKRAMCAVEKTRTRSLEWYSVRTWTWSAYQRSLRTFVRTVFTLICRNHFHAWAGFVAPPTPKPTPEPTAEPTAEPDSGDICHAHGIKCQWFGGSHPPDWCCDNCLNHGVPCDPQHCNPDDIPPTGHCECEDLLCIPETRKFTNWI